MTFSPDASVRELGQVFGSLAVGQFDSAAWKALEAEHDLPTYNQSSYVVRRMKSTYPAFRWATCSMRQSKVIATAQQYRDRLREKANRL